MKPEEYRTLFLKEFTKSLIENSSKKKKDILPFHPVKPKQAAMPREDSSPKFYIPILETEQNIPSILNTEEIKPGIQPGTSGQLIDMSEMSPSIKSQSTAIPVPYPDQMRVKPQFEKRTQPVRMPAPQTRIERPQPVIKPLTQAIQSVSSPESRAIASITPTPQPLPPGFSLGKLDPLILDRTITMMECPGPGKPMIVSSSGRVAQTRIILGEQDIKDIIDTFSKSTKIPAIGGMFKAALGNLVITAVISDYVGSRFIINKYTPYSVLENRQ